MPAGVILPARSIFRARALLVHPQRLSLWRGENRTQVVPQQESISFLSGCGPELNVGQACEVPARWGQPDSL